MITEDHDQGLGGLLTHPGHHVLGERRREPLHPRGLCFAGFGEITRDLIEPEQLARADPQALYGRSAGRRWIRAWPACGARAARGPITDLLGLTIAR